MRHIAIAVLFICGAIAAAMGFSNHGMVRYPAILRGETMNDIARNHFGYSGGRSKLYDIAMKHPNSYAHICNAEIELTRGEIKRVYDNYDPYMKQSPQGRMLAEKMLHRPIKIGDHLSQYGFVCLDRGGDSVRISVSAVGRFV